MKYNLAAALLLIIFAFMVLTSVNTKSPVCDAAGFHIASGYSFLKTGDFRMNPSAPPLLRILMTLPLLPLDLEFPEGGRSSTEISYEFLYEQERTCEMCEEEFNLKNGLGVQMGKHISYFCHPCYGKADKNELFTSVIEKAEKKLALIGEK